MSGVFDFVTTAMVGGASGVSGGADSAPRIQRHEGVCDRSSIDFRVCSLPSEKVMGMCGEFLQRLLR